MTDIIHPTEAAAIIAVTRDGIKPQDVEPGCIYVVHTASGYELVDLTGDDYREFPEHKQGTVTVRDVASLGRHYAKHSDNDSEVFADLDAATVTAVLDAHRPGAARWQMHRVILRMQKTPEWLTWTASDRKLMSQQDFAEFIEDNASAIAPDGPVTAADLLEIAQSFQAHTRVQFSSGKRLSSGETQFTYSEDTTASAGGKGTISIPSEFELGIRPLEDCVAWRIKARFRYRLSDGTLRLGYHLDDPARAFREAVSDVTGQAEEACGVTIMRGQPA